VFSEVINELTLIIFYYFIFFYFFFKFLLPGPIKNKFVEITFSLNTVND